MHPAACCASPKAQPCLRLLSVLLGHPFCSSAFLGCCAPASSALNTALSPEPPPPTLPTLRNGDTLQRPGAETQWICRSHCTVGGRRCPLARTCRVWAPPPTATAGLAPLATCRLGLADDKNRRCGSSGVAFSRLTDCLSLWLSSLQAAFRLPQAAVDSLPGAAGP